MWRLGSRSLRMWAPLPVGVGVACLCYQHTRRRWRQRNEAAGVVTPMPLWKVSLYSSVPLRWSSRQFGRLMDARLPVCMRRPVIGTYAWLFDCDTSEAVHADLAHYANLAEFFRRRVKSELRPISRSALVCPCDGRVHTVGKVNEGRIEQVKGIDYSLREFVGPHLALPQRAHLRYCVIYLSPGDYHGLHSPADWSVGARRHIAGLMLSVRLKLLDKLGRLLCMNERVALHGEWLHGYFSMTAVAATNVGNIRIEHDTLRTNRADYDGGSRQVDDCVYGTQWRRSRGDRIGEFRLGSSVVLVFEAPDTFNFAVQPGDRVRYGQSLGFIRQ